MANKDPTPRADQLRQQRETRYGHLQATAEPKKAPVKKIAFAGKPRVGAAATFTAKRGRKAKTK